MLVGSPSEATVSGGMGFTRKGITTVLLLVGVFMLYSNLLTDRHMDSKHRQSLETVSDHPEGKLMRGQIADGHRSLPNAASDATLLAVSCAPGVPCRYPDHFDLRVIVMTHRRSESLLKILKSLDNLELDGDRAVLEIWVDRAEDGSVHKDTGCGQRVPLVLRAEPCTRLERARGNHRAVD